MLSGRSGFYLKVGKLYHLYSRGKQATPSLSLRAVKHSMGESNFTPSLLFVLGVNSFLSSLFFFILKLQNQDPWSHLRLRGYNELFRRCGDWCVGMRLGTNSCYTAPPEIRSKEEILGSGASIYSGGKTGWKLEPALKIAWIILVSWQHSGTSLLENAILKVLICMLEIAHPLRTPRTS